MITVKNQQPMHSDQIFQSKFQLKLNTEKSASKYKGIIYSFMNQNVVFPIFGTLIAAIDTAVEFTQKCQHLVLHQNII